MESDFARPTARQALREFTTNVVRPDGHLVDSRAVAGRQPLTSHFSHARSPGFEYEIEVGETALVGVANVEQQVAAKEEI
jgi:hypothetical protein